MIPRDFSGRSGSCARTPPYPPDDSLVNLLVSGPRRGEVRPPRCRGGGLVQRARRAARAAGQGAGPGACPLVRIKDRWRWHVLLKGPSELLGRVVRYAARRLPRAGKTRVVIDRDPVSLL